MGILSTISNLLFDPESRRLARARKALAAERAEMRAESLRKRRRNIQETYQQDNWFQPFFERLNEHQTDPSFFPYSNQQSKKYGNNWPYYETEQQLDMYRTLSRSAYHGNNHGKGILFGLRNYVIGKGMIFRATARRKSQSKEPAVVAVINKVQDWLDAFFELNDFAELQQEAFCRSKYDGEYLWRHFPREDGQTVIRFIWPEHLRCPRGGDAAVWNYGIRCLEGDIETPLEYSLDFGTTEEPEVVGAEAIDHCKCNVERGIKRGMPELCLDMRDSLEMARKLRRNMAEGAAIQAAIAWIRKHSAASSSQINDFAAAQRDYRNPRVSIDGDTYRNAEFFDSGTILDIDANQEYQAPPGAENIPGYVGVVQACLRAAASRWNAPEGLASGDYSNSNFASALVAEAPFRRGCETEQEFYANRFRKTIRKAIRHAIDIGALPRDTFDLVDVQAEPQSLEVRNKLEEMQTNQGYSMMGILSPQTIAQQQGLDWENEQGNIEAASVRRGPEGSALPLPGDDDPLTKLVTALNNQGS